MINLQETTLEENEVLRIIKNHDAKTYDFIMNAKISSSRFINTIDGYSFLSLAGKVLLAELTCPKKYVWRVSIYSKITQYYQEKFRKIFEQETKPTIIYNYGTIFSILTSEERIHLKRILLSKGCVVYE